MTRTGTGRMMPLGYDPAEVLVEERLSLAESMAGWQEKFPDVEVHDMVVFGRPVSTLVHASNAARLLVVGLPGPRFRAQRRPGLGESRGADARDRAGGCRPWAPLRWRRPPAPQTREAHG